MKKDNEFPFHRARKITPEEVEWGRRAIEKLTGKPRLPRGRPPKAAEDKYELISIRLHPKAAAWARRLGRKRGVGYQTIINETLLAQTR